MTRDQQVAKALALLAPPPAQREECEYEIRQALEALAGPSSSRELGMADVDRLAGAALSVLSESLSYRNDC